MIVIRASSPALGYRKTTTPSAKSWQSRTRLLTSNKRITTPPSESLLWEEDRALMIRLILRGQAPTREAEFWPTLANLYWYKGMLAPTQFRINVMIKVKSAASGVSSSHELSQIRINYQKTFLKFLRFQQRKAICPRLSSKTKKNRRTLKHR